MRKNVPPSCIPIMLASLADNSLKQYDSCIKKWYLFCHTNNLNLFAATVTDVLSFLKELYDGGAQYGTLNSCRSAVSLILGQDLSNNDLIKRFFKGIYRLRPPLPRYNVTWDTSLVLDGLASWYPNNSLDLSKISQKLATLLALTTAHRVQTLSKINTKNLEFLGNEVRIKIPDLIKTSRPGTSQPMLILPTFHERPAICPVTTLLS